MKISGEEKKQGRDVEGEGSDIDTYRMQPVAVIHSNWLQVGLWSFCS